MSILLIRHGETNANATGVIQLADEPLSERGVGQARRLGVRLASSPAPPVGRIFASDLRRATMTAEAIASATGAAVEIQPLLQERDFGELRGRTYAEVGVDIMAEGYLPPQGESWEAFDQRVVEAWRWLCGVLGAARESAVRERRDPDAAVAIVTHGLVCGSLARNHLALPAGVEAPAHWGNTSLTTFEAQPPWRVSTLNCTAHLDGDLGDDESAVSGI